MTSPEQHQLKPYRAPELRHYGAITKLVQGMGGSGADGSSGMAGMSMGLGVGVDIGVDLGL